MTVELVQLREVDLTRYVRTPEGARYYKKPIGSPIGGGGGKSIMRVAAKAASSTPRPMKAQGAFAASGKVIPAAPSADGISRMSVENALKNPITRDKVTALIAQHNGAMKLLKKKPNLKNTKQANVFFRALERIAPSLKNKFDAIRNSGLADRLKNFKYIETLVESTLDVLVKNVLGTGIIVAASTLGVKLISG